MTQKYEHEETVSLLPISGTALENGRQSFLYPKPGFLLGIDNRIIEAAVHIVLSEKQTKTTPYPLYFYGRSGIGKTHLSLGLYSEWKKIHPKKKSAFFAGADFARVLADSIEAKTTDDLKRRLRSLNLLVIDNVDDLKNKSAAQEELMHALDALHKSGSVVVLTGKELPLGNTPFFSQLTARIQAGTPIQIKLPSEPVRAVFVKQVAESHNMKIPHSSFALLSRELQTTLPLIYGTLLQIKFESEAKGAKLSVNDIKELLRKRTEANRPTLPEITQVAARHFGVKMSDIRGKTRRSCVAQARSVSVYLARNMTEMSLKDIGSYLGERDHTTISHLKDSIEKRISEDTELKSSVKTISEQIKKIKE